MCVKKAWKNRSFFTRNIISWARVRIVCNPLTRPTFRPQDHIVVTSVLVYGRYCRRETVSRPYVRARWLFDVRLIREPEMIGNRLDPRHGLAVLCERDFREARAISNSTAPFCERSDTPTLPAVGLLTTQSTPGINPWSEYRAREKERFNETAVCRELERRWKLLQMSEWRLWVTRTRKRLSAYVDRRIENVTETICKFKE